MVILRDLATKEIPDDIIYEITSRASLRTVDSCKLLSRYWHHIIHEPSFTQLYYNRTKNVSGYFLQDYKKKYIAEFVSPDSPEEPGWAGSFVEKYLGPEVEILASCRQGLLFCRKMEGRKCTYYACKPTTGQWRGLPTPSKPSQPWSMAAIMVLGWGPPLRYKIVRLVPMMAHVRGGRFWVLHKCFLFESDAWRWRLSGTISVPIDMVIYSRSTTAVAGSVYWLTNCYSVLEFREPDESFHIFDLPSHVQDTEHIWSQRLVEYRGQLGFVFLRESDDFLELWVKGLDLEWRKVKEVEAGRAREYGCKFGYYNGGIVFMKEHLDAMFYNTEDLSMSRVRLERACDWRDIFQFRSDFEPVELGGRRRPVAEKVAQVEM